MLSSPDCISDTLRPEEARLATLDPSSNELVLTPKDNVDFTRFQNGTTYKPTSVAGINIESGQVVFWFEKV